MEKANTDEDSHEPENILKEKIESAKKKLDVAKNTNNKDGEGDAYCELTELWYKYGDYEKSIEYGAELVKIAKNVGKIEWEIAAYDVLGWSYYNKENYKQSIKYGKDELSIATKSRQRVEEGRALKILAWSYYFEKEYTQSIEYGNQLLTIANEIGKREDIINANEILADAYNATGKRKKANEHRKEQKALEKGTEAAAAGESPNYSSESSQDGEREKESTERGLEKRSDSGDFKETKEEETDEARGRFPNGSSSENPQDGEREKESAERGLEKRSDSGDSKETKEGETDKVRERFPNGSSPESPQDGEREKESTEGGLEKRSDSGDFKETKEEETDKARERLPNGNSPVVPSEIEARGPGANVASENELNTKKVKLYRARIILIGQDHAGKTSLKKSLFGLPFESEKESTAEAIKVDPTVFDVDVMQVKNWPHSDDARIAATEVKEEEPNDIKMNEGPELKIDPTLRPEQVTDVLVQYLRDLNLQSDPTSVENHTTLDVWDFAGQHLCYALYPVFLSPRAVYMLIYNLSEGLEVSAPPRFRKGVFEKDVQNENETNLENLLSWLTSVSTLCYTKTDVAEKSTGLRPPIFIVGTHADKPRHNIKKMETRIQKEIFGKKFSKHVIRSFFTVDNTQGSSGKGLADLQNEMNEVLKKEPYMGKEVPLRWLKFEKVVQALVTAKVYYLKLEQLQTIIQEVCFVEGENEVADILDFYHGLGMIVKHHNTVVLQAQWLIGIFKQLIAIPAFKEMEAIHEELWQTLEEDGVLSMELVNHVFSELCPIKEDILDMMEQFGLIVKFSTSSTDDNYFVPCQLKTPPSGVVEMNVSSSDPFPLYLHFEWGFVPHGFFSQLVSEFTRFFSKSRFSKPFTISPYFYDKVSKFLFFEKETLQHHLVMLCKKGHIEIVLKKENPNCSEVLAEIMANTVRQSLENAIQSLTSKLPWLKDLKTDWCAACPNKQQNSVCRSLRKILDGEKLMDCKKCRTHKTPTQPRHKKWFLMKATVPSTTEASLPTLPTLPTATLTIATSSQPVTAPAATKPSTETFQQSAEHLLHDDGDDNENGDGDDNDDESDSDNNDAGNDGFVSSPSYVGGDDGNHGNISDAVNDEVSEEQELIQPFHEFQLMGQEGDPVEQDPDKTKIHEGTVTSKGAHWDLKQGAVQLTFPPGAVSEPISIMVLKWKCSACSPQLQEHEAIVSNVIEISAKNGQPLEFNAQVMLMLYHSAPDLQGYELVIKMQIDKEISEWVDVDGTEDLRRLRGIDTYASSQDMQDSNCFIARASITKCSTYTVVYRLKSSPPYTITSNGGSFGHPHYPGVTVYIPEEAVAPNTTFSLVLKAQEIPFQEYEEQDVFVGPFLRIICPQGVEFLKPVTIHLPVHVRGGPKGIPDPLSYHVRVLFLRSDGEYKEWIDITGDLEHPASFDGTFVKFQVKHFSRFTCILGRDEESVSHPGVVSRLKRLFWKPPRVAQFFAFFRSLDNSCFQVILCLICCTAKFRKEVLQELKSEGITPSEDHSVMPMIPEHDKAYVFVSGGISALDIAHTKDYHLRFESKSPHRKQLGVRLCSDQGPIQVEFYSTPLKKKLLSRLFLATPSVHHTTSEEPTPYQQPAVRPGYHPGTGDVYNMTAHTRGITLIINNNLFGHDIQPTRKGSKEDVREVAALFSALGFKVEIKQNLTKPQLKEELKSVARQDHSGYDCFVLWLMSHGESGKVLCYDGNTLPIQSAHNMLNKCTTLRGKPKLFFIQACRGDKNDEGFADMTDVLSPLEDPPAHVDPPSDADNPSATRIIPTHTDFLYSYATVDGYVSYRRSDKGSRFVRALVDVFRERANSDHLLDMLTVVNKNVSELVMRMPAPGGKSDIKYFKQMPEVKHTLRKKLWF